jgi:hypothetical protein
MKMRLIMLCAVSVAFLFNSGCITYTSKGLDPVATLPHVEKKPSVGINYTFSRRYNGEIVPATDFLSERTRTRLIKAFEKTGYFCTVKLNDASAELQLDINAEFYSQGSLALAKLSGATLCLIPCRAEDGYLVTAKMLNKRTGKISELKADDSLVLWIHLIFLPCVPFCYDTQGEDREICETIMTHIARQAFQAAEVTK